MLEIGNNLTFILLCAIITVGVLVAKRMDKS